MSETKYTERAISASALATLQLWSQATHPDESIRLFDRVATYIESLEADAAALRAELAEARGLLSRVNDTRVDDIPAWLRLLREILNFLNPPYSPAEPDARGTTGEDA